jgi:uncharacterized membrane protein YdbT with pleckstrin-like domain
VGSRANTAPTSSFSIVVALRAALAAVVALAAGILTLLLSALGLLVVAAASAFAAASIALRGVATAGEWLTFRGGALARRLSGRAEA